MFSVMAWGLRSVVRGLQSTGSAATTARSLPGLDRTHVPVPQGDSYPLDYQGGPAYLFKVSSWGLHKVSLFRSLFLKSDITKKPCKLSEK